MLQLKSLRTPRRTLCLSLHSQNAHGHATRAILCENLQEKRGGTRSGRRDVWASAAEMHMDIAQEQLYARIKRKIARSQSANPDLAPVLTTSVRTPQLKNQYCRCSHNRPIIFPKEECLDLSAPHDALRRALMSPRTKVWSSARVVRSCTEADHSRNGRPPNSTSLSLTFVYYR